LSRETFGISERKTYLTMTSSQLASLVRVFPLRENVEVFKTSQGELFSSKSAESHEIKDRATYFLRMLKAYFLTTEAEPSQLYSFRWMSLGMMRNGLSQTLSITYRKIGKGSLSSVLEEKADEKYHLSEKTLKKILGKKDAHPDIRWKSGIKGEGRVPFPDDPDKPSRAITTAEGGANRMTHGIMVLADILEEEVDEKYYLSEKMVNGIIKSNFMDRKPQDLNRESGTIKVGGDVKCIVTEEENGQIQQREKKRNNVEDTGKGHEDGGRLQENTMEIGHKRLEEALGQVQDRHSVPEEESGDIPRQLLLARMPEALQEAEDEQEILASEDRGEQKEGQEDIKIIEERRMEGNKDLGTRPKVQALRWQRTEKGKKSRREAQRKGRDYTPFNEGSRELVLSEEDISGCVTHALNKDALILAERKLRIRRLTPKECERLQGFPDNWTNGASDTQRYKQMGNAVSVPVIEAIGRKILECVA